LSTRSRKITQPEPIPDQHRPDKKSKLFDPEKIPIPNLKLTTQSHGESEEMEAQGEKKKRREEEVLINNSNGSEHFLTASPGSQDCRDQ
jgi:hypothetical protein